VIVHTLTFFNVGYQGSQSCLMIQMRFYWKLYFCIALESP